ncbi:Methylenetetrahydrofolate reductase [Camponotus japonicus]
MRKFIFEENLCERSNTDKNESEDDSPTYDSLIKNRPLQFTDLRQSIKDKITKSELFYSFEIVSGRKSKAFYQRLLLNMDKYSPLFYALTWHKEEGVFSNHSYLPLELVENFPSNTLLHLAAKGLKRDKVVCILKKALAFGIINIFALQGDSLSEDGDFKYAVDLVAFIREQFGDTFCICVAGYPQMHPKSVSKELDLYYLKAKVEAGADFIITQICFESEIFIDFVKDCRKIGIQVPILPGIFAPTSYKYLEKMADICRVDVPMEIKNDLARIKDDDQATRKFMIDLTVRIITDIIKSGTTRGFHLFTLNRLSLVEEICSRIDFPKPENA